MEKKSLLWKTAITAVCACALFLYWFIAREWIIAHQATLVGGGSDFAKAISQVGGLASFIGQALTSLFHNTLMGALVIAVISIILQQLVWNEMEAKTDALFLQSFIPTMLLLWLMGDRDVLLSYPVALILSLAVSAVVDRKCIYLDLVVIPLLYWLLGAAAWTYVLVRIVHCGWRTAWTALYMLVLQIATAIAIDGITMRQAIFGWTYHSDPAYLPALQVIIPIVIFLMVIPVRSMQNKDASYRGAMISQLIFLLIITACAVLF